MPTYEHLRSPPPSPTDMEDYVSWVDAHLRELMIDWESDLGEFTAEGWGFSDYCKMRYMYRRMARVVGDSDDDDDDE